MSHRPSHPPFPIARNSTIKQEQEPNHQHNLENDSSISLREGADVHYYDLDYSDEHQNNDIVSSSDEEGREITHQEFMQMISTNLEKKSKGSEGLNSGDHSQQRYSDDEDEDEYQREREQQMRYQRRKPHTKKYPQSNDFKRGYYQQKNKKNSPSTRDKSYNFYQYAHKHQRNQRNDPQKSNELQKHIKQSKELSYNEDNSVNTVKEFRIDSFSYGHINPNHKDKSKAWKQFRERKPQPAEQDSSFSLITLPQYDEETSSLHLIKRKSQQMIENNKQNHMKRLSKYQNIAKLQEQEDNAYDKLNWRYQEAKLKFMDSFLPDSMKIANNSYNMLKYIATKNDLTFNILKAL